LPPGGERAAPRLVTDTEPARRPAGRLSRWLQIVILVLLAVAPLALGAVHAPVFVPLLVAWITVGIASWGLGRWLRAQGVSQPLVPGRRLLVLLHVLVLLQLLPLPPWLLARVSPGSFAFYNDLLLAPRPAWRPIAVSPADTLRGLVFLLALTLLYAAAYRELRDDRARRRVAGTVVLTAFVMTLVALGQAASGSARIYGVWQPRYDWAVFGPYVNKNHFAGYMVMALPLALAFAQDAFAATRAAWARRKRGWLALGDPVAQAAIRWVAAAMVLMIGLLSSRSRGGVGAFAIAALVVGARLRQRTALLLSATVAALGLGWVGMGQVAGTFANRGLLQGRSELWADALPLAARFPLGDGLNGFGTAYARWQTYERNEWFGEAHNEYLQALLDLGLPGALLVALAVLLLLRAAWTSAHEGPFEGGLLAAVLGACAHNLVEFNWQIPANAATFAVLAGLALRRPATTPPRRRRGRFGREPRPNLRLHVVGP
jgi:O-antigen ligase